MASNTSEEKQELVQNEQKPRNSLDLLSEDELLDSLPRTPYKDGWPEDRWREEFENHPFFMTQPPDPSKELPPLIEGLQQLKYSETENTPDELAKTYKDDGNFYFKCKKYRDAISHYTTGIKLDCSNELKAQLFNNRSAANYFLQNFKSALNDCEETLKVDSTYKKARIRKAQCLFQLEKYDECIECCDDIVSLEGLNTDVMKLKKDSIQKNKLKTRDSRKDAKKEQNESAEEKFILQCIKDRKINIRLIGNKKLRGLSDLEPDPALPVKLDRVHTKNDKLFWPVLYNFPELSLNMPINEFDEDRTFEALLLTVAEGMTEYDLDRKFVPDNVRIFFQDKDEKLVEFYINRTLRSVMSDKRFILSDGVVFFHLFLKDSEFTREYLRRAELSFLLT